MELNKIFLLGCGTLAGGFSRYFLSGWIHRILGTTFPYGTFTVNMIGCFLIGLFASFADKKIFIDAEGRLLLMIGFCGAFTTFSTFMLETSDLIQNGEIGRAFLNIAASVVVGFLVLRLGILLGECFSW